MGRGGWISRGLVFGLDRGGEEEMCVGGGGGDKSGGVEEGGAVGRREVLGGGFSIGGEDGICSRGFLVPGGEGRVGDGELD